VNRRCKHEYEEGCLWVFGAGFGGVSTAVWSPATEHIGVAVSSGHRPLCGGFVTIGCMISFLFEHNSFISVVCKLIFENLRSLESVFFNLSFDNFC
jgi:hypothetical protein